MISIFRKKKPKRLKYLFFDFDGTISDAKKLTYETLITVLDRMDYKFSKARTKNLQDACSCYAKPFQGIYTL